MSASEQLSRRPALIVETRRVQKPPHATSKQPGLSLPLYPLALQPLAVERPWGGEALRSRFEKHAVPGQRIGETWETGLDSLVLHGDRAGQSLGDVAREWGPALVGTRPRASRDVPFPLLVKFIDAADKLSVQVHPDDVGALEAGHTFGKTEAWYIIDAGPEAVLYHGWRAPMCRDEVADALSHGVIERYLRQIPARSGEALFTPAGTIHAIGAGVLLYEVQQYSDVTYRLHDWNRVASDGSARELHVARGMEALDFGHDSPTPVTGLQIEPGRDVLTACRYFALERWTLAASRHTRLDGATCHIATVLSGTASLAASGLDPVTVAAGRTVVVPAGCGDYVIEPAGTATVLVAYCPDLAGDVVAPLREAGHTDTAIAGLGGGPIGRNDLRPLLAPS